MSDIIKASSKRQSNKYYYMLITDNVLSGHTKIYHKQATQKMYKLKKVK